MTHDHRPARPLRGPLYAAAVFAVAVLLGALTGCGDSESGSGDEEKTPVVTVGALPIADDAPLFLGMERGFFKQQGIDVRTELSESGAALLPAILKGDYQFGFSNVISLFIARSQGLPVKILAPGSADGTSVEDSIEAIVVREDSSIRKPRDLAGKTIAVNALRNIGEVSIRGALDKLGVDSSSVRFLEVPFPDMNAALTSKQVDAVWQAEPFLSPALADNGRAVLATLPEIEPHLQSSAYFTSESYARENADTVRRFTAGLRKALAYSRDHPDAVRRVLPTYTELPREAVKHGRLPFYSPDLDQGDLRLLLELSTRYELVEEPLELSELVVAGS